MEYTHTQKRKRERKREKKRDISLAYTKKSQQKMSLLGSRTSAADKAPGPNTGSWGKKGQLGQAFGAKTTGIVETGTSRRGTMKGYKERNNPRMM